MDSSLLMRISPASGVGMGVSELTPGLGDEHTLHSVEVELVG